MPPQETKIKWTYEKIVLMFNKWIAEHGVDQVGFTVAYYLAQAYEAKDMASVIQEGCEPIGTTPTQFIEALSWGEGGSLYDDGEDYFEAMGWFESEFSQMGK